MARVYKRGKVYYAEWKDDNGITRRKSCQTGTKQVALRRLKKYEVGKSTETLAESLDYLFTHTCRRLQSKTLRAKRNHGKNLQAGIGNVDIKGITRPVVQAYINHRRTAGVKDHTIHKELCTLRQALSESMHRRLYHHNPLVEVPRLSGYYDPRERFLTREEYSLLTNHLEPARSWWVRVAVFTGCRVGELSALEWTDLDLQNQAMRIRGTKTKGSDRVVPIHPELIFPFQNFTRNRNTIVEPWSNHLRDIKAACDQVGIQHVTPNDLRRTFASWMRQAGVDSQTIANCLGHASTRMAERVYAKNDLASMRRAMMLMSEAV